MSLKTAAEELSAFDVEHLLNWYEQMTLVRRFESAVQQLYRKALIPGFIHLYVGQEATAVGVCATLRADDFITSTHRGHGHALAKGVPPKDLMAELCGKAAGCSGGRGGSMHVFAPKYGLYGTTGLVAGGIPVAVGLGFSAKARKTDQVAVSFFGDGAINHGAFHEAANLAAAQNVPVVFVCENNLYATSTPVGVATRTVDLAEKARAYDIPGVSVDGNDVLAVRTVAREAVERARRGEGPTLIEAKTYRIVGHHEGDTVFGTYRTEAEVNAWRERCPIKHLRTLLIGSERATEEELDAIEAQVEEHVREAVEFALAAPEPDPGTATDHIWANPIHPDLPETPPGADTDEQSWTVAVRDAIAAEMRRNPNLLYFGEGIGERGGSFAHTVGLWAEFGGGRVIDTAISELGFTGASIGAAIAGVRAISDLMIADFLFDASSQLVAQAAKLRYMSNGQLSVPIVIRAGAGLVKNTGPHHSGTYHAVWAHIPGLVVAVPSTPADAKGLIATALREATDPVVFLEHKALFGMRGPTPTGEHFVPFGQARIARAGGDLTVVTCGLMVHRCIEAADRLAQEGIHCEVLDLRTIVPLDVDSIVASLCKTHHMLVVDEDYAMCGLGSEIAAIVMEHAFDEVDAPVGRLHQEPVASPFSPVLERQTFVTTDKIVAAAKGVVAGSPLVQRRPATAKRAQDAPATVSTRALVRPSSDSLKPSTAAANQGGVDLIVPNQDMTVTEATIVQWLKAPGDTVAAGESVVQIETDKAASDVEAPVSGTLAEILAPADTVVELGQRIAVILPA